MITVFTGRPRSGKTNSAVRFLIMECLNRGLKVYSNMPIRWAGFDTRSTWRRYIPFYKHVQYPASNLSYWYRLEDLYDLEGGVIFMDEIGVFLPSRKWEGLPERMQWKLLQHGKDRLDLIGTVQHINRMDIIIRELVDFWFNVGRYPIPKNPVRAPRPWFFYYREYDIDEDKLRKFPLRTRFYFASKSQFASYDTLFKLAPDAPRLVAPSVVDAPLGQGFALAKGGDVGAT